MLVILDLDGVILDYGPSSREAAARAAGAYLEEVCGIVNGSHLVHRHHIDALKRSGGFEDDRELVYAMVYHLLTSLTPPLRPPSPQPRALPRRAEHVRKAFQKRDVRLHMLIGHSERDLEPVLKEINKRGGGVEGVKGYFGDGVMEKFILHEGSIGATEREAALGADADAETRAKSAAEYEDLISRLYEEFYLGDAAFEATYGIPPMKPRGAGLRFASTLLHPLEKVERMTALSSVALLVNQPKAQLAETLTHAGIATMFPQQIHEMGLNHKPPPRPKTRKSLNQIPVYVVPSPIRFNARMFKHAFKVATMHHGYEHAPKKAIFYVSSDPHRLELSVASGVRTVAFTQERGERRKLKELGVKAVISKLDTLLKALEAAK